MIKKVNSIKWSSIPYYVLELLALPSNISVEKKAEIDRLLKEKKALEAEISRLNLLKLKINDSLRFNCFHPQEKFFVKCYEEDTGSSIVITYVIECIGCGKEIQKAMEKRSYDEHILADVRILKDVFKKLKKDKDED